MKRLFFALAFVLFLVTTGIAYKIYDRYQAREGKIEEILEFQKIAIEAYSMLASGKFKESSYLYEKAIAIYDKDPKTLFDYSGVLARLGRDKEAALMLERAYNSANFKNEETLGMVAKMFFDIADHEKSLKYYKEAIERFRPKYRYIEKVILSLDSLGRYDEAMGYFAYIQHRDSDYFKEKEEFSKFLNLYTKETEALNLLPKYDTTEGVDALLALGVEYEKRGLSVKALRAYDKLLLSEPNHQEANRKIADLLMSYKDYDHALRHLLVLEDSSFDALFKIGKVYHQIKNYDKAIEYYEKALKIEQNALLLKNLASCSLKSGDKERIFKYLSKLRELDPREAYNFKHIAMISMGEKMSIQDKLTYQAINLWYDFKKYLQLTI